MNILIKCINKEQELCIMCRSIYRGIFMNRKHLYVDIPERCTNHKVCTAHFRLFNNPEHAPQHNFRKTHSE